MTSHNRNPRLERTCEPSHRGGAEVNGGCVELDFFADVILNAAKGISSAYARGEPGR
ncbi:hypothetical protein [Microbacterium resistens]|uniref:Uncharacterized protein n=1 Tax=Microbacterium oxydans TaxID=82380 RepID=A0A0F0KVE9_9MICO|nr:hypothetical protein RN51_00998 [Microbacterium oxydans]